MGSARRRLEALEGKIRARASPGERPSRRTPEQEARREEQFEELFRELGMPWPPAPTNPERVREELFAAIESHREEIDRKEREA